MSYLSNSSSSGGLSKRNPQPLYPSSSSSTLLPSYAPSRSATPLYPGSLTPTPYVNDYNSGYPSRSGTPGGGGGYSSNKSLEGLEGQSEDRLEGLFGKVKILKDITVNIGTEVKDGTFELDSMNDIFSSTSTAIKGTMRRMGIMSRKVGGQWCWLMLFLILCGWIFVGLWMVRR